LRKGDRKRERERQRERETERERQREGCVVLLTGTKTERGRGVSHQTPFPVNFKDWGHFRLVFSSFLLLSSLELSDTQVYEP